MAENTRVAVGLRTDGQVDVGYFHNDSLSLTTFNVQSSHSPFGTAGRHLAREIKGDLDLVDLSRCLSKDYKTLTPGHLICFTDAYNSNQRDLQSVS